jgi:hypothetical protein
MRSEAKKLVRPHLVLVTASEPVHVFRGPLAHYPEPVVQARPNAYDAEGLGLVDEQSGLRRKSIPPQEPVELLVGDDELTVLEDRNPIDFDEVAHWYPAHAQGGDEEVPAAPGIPPFRVSRITLVPTRN